MSVYIYIYSWKESSHLWLNIPCGMHSLAPPCPQLSVKIPGKEVQTWWTRRPQTVWSTCSGCIQAAAKVKATKNNLSPYKIIIVIKPIIVQCINYVHVPAHMYMYAYTTRLIIIIYSQKNVLCSYVSGFGV